MKVADPALYRVDFMNRRYRSRHAKYKGLVQAAPLMNIVLLLLLFVITNSKMVLRPGIVVNIPDSPFMSGVPYDALVVTVSQEGLIFYNDERTTLEGLGSAFAQTAYAHPDTALVIEADERVRHSTLIEIYNMAMQAGIKQIALATRVPSISVSAP